VNVINKLTLEFVIVSEAVYPWDYFGLCPRKAKLLLLFTII